jgi:hypothetical protein
MALAATTLSGAITGSQSTIKLAAFTNPSTGGVGPETIVQVDGEQMRVTSAAFSPTLSVVRGSGQVVVTPHQSGAPAVYGLTSDFTQQVSPGSAPIATYSVAGAITVPTVDAIIYLTGAAATHFTLAAPADDQTNKVTIQALAAQAYLVTQTTPGFNNGSTAADVATFGGAIGDSFTFVAQSGVWNVTTLHNVTLG